jgi:hypothetical protein
MRSNDRTVSRQILRRMATPPSPLDVRTAILFYMITGCHLQREIDLEQTLI